LSVGRAFCEADNSDYRKKAMKASATCRHQRSENADLSRVQTTARRYGSLSSSNAYCPCGGGCPRCKAAATSPGSRPIQAKSQLGPIDDPAEKEADAVAERVMARSPADRVATVPPVIRRKPRHRAGDGASDLPTAPAESVLAAPGEHDMVA
jgi:hypothetical protein